MALGVSCTPYVIALRYGTGDYQSTRVFERPFNEAWNAVMNVMQAYPIRTIEKESGIIVTDVIYCREMPEYKVGFYEEKKVPENCVIIDPYAFTNTPGLPVVEVTPSGHMRCNVRVERVDDTHTRVSINIVSTISYPVTVVANTPSNVKKDFETASRGYFEAVLLWKIAKELGINEPEPPQPKF